MILSMGLATVFMFKPTKNNLFRHLNIKKKIIIKLRLQKISQNRKSIYDYTHLHSTHPGEIIQLYTYPILEHYLKFYANDRFT